jgi:hypothetical protein
MAVRKTEQRIPAGFVAEDLGQTVSSADGKVALVSFNSTPVVHQRLQDYVVFVLDVALAAQVDHYDWSIQNGDSLDTSVTQFGYLQYRPELEGGASVQVTLKGASDQTLGTLEMDQEVVPLHSELEALYEQTVEIAPLAGQPETSREVINDLRSYMDELAPRDADPSSSLNHLIFAIAYVEVMGLPAEQRNPMLEHIATSFNADDSTAFAEEGSAGVGVCRIRPHVLGMYLPQTSGGTDWYLNKREYPAEEGERLSINRELLEELADLGQEKQIDLFNLLRFPKSNLKMAIQLLGGLKEQYFPGEELESLLNNRDKIERLLDQFKRGPYQSA